MSPNRTDKFVHEFVRLMPKDLQPHVLYVSMEFATAVHLCACGCGSKVVTPLAPTDWKLTFDGEAVSLYPSIGSWALPCRSHYWIAHGRVDWSGDWPEEWVHEGRRSDRDSKRAYFDEKDASLRSSSKPTEPSLWGRLQRKLRKRK